MRSDISEIKRITLKLRGFCQEGGARGTGKLLTQSNRDEILGEKPSLIVISLIRHILEYLRLTKEECGISFETTADPVRKMEFRQRVDNLIAIALEFIG